MIAGSTNVTTDVTIPNQINFNMEMEISQTVSIASLNLDEGWLQERIWDNPSALGLGELEAVSKEQSVSSGGRLDILLKNPVDDAMYEVEVLSLIHI